MFLFVPGIEVGLRVRRDVGFNHIVVTCCLGPTRPRQFDQQRERLPAFTWTVLKTVAQRATAIQCLPPLSFCSRMLQTRCKPAGGDGGAQLGRHLSAPHSTPQAALRPCCKQRPSRPIRQPPWVNSARSPGTSPPLALQYRVSCGRSLTTPIALRR